MLVGCLGFMAYQPMQVTQHQIHFMQIVLFQTIQFNMSTQFNCQKTFLFQAIQFSQTVIIQFSISTDFIYTQLNVKSVLYITIQFSVNTVSMSKKQFYFKEFSLA